ncbi:hypothetical protein B0H67DRAFT_491001 [Lasiosphaeris hirsuta]|uniref:Zn(2)-C6 fungal-type domain-containing protein n=1 Tax=Lasiosphaeris hirsuta TaxID=260670 RepID=A0AA40AIB2_9PEZI|nr:hypothetical protein B0H67DRAFT_491001 [Lasiosphaeris hirsuta]
MLKRRSHNKSRNGCLNCKQRRIKCDEQGPPCASCVARPWATHAPCVYQTIAPPSSTPPKSLASQPEQLANSSLPGSPSASLPTSPCSFSNTPEHNRLLELELMHRWSMRSWKAFYAIPECQPYLLNYLPRAALGHSYLLNAILAAAAMDIAITSAPIATTTYETAVTRSPRGHSSSLNYLRAALEYGNRASADFRSQVTCVSRDNIDLVVYFSSMAAVIAFATSPYLESSNGSTLDRVVTYFDMLISSARIHLHHTQWLLESPCPAGVVASEYSINLGLLEELDAGTRTAIDLLSSVARQVRLPQPGVTASEVLAYQLAVGQTKYCFAEDHRGRIKNFFVTLPTVAGDVFTTAMRAREPVALFITMYWGVLVHRAAEDPQMWAAGATGQQLVGEVSEMLLSLSGIAGIANIREGIAWTRSQVGLEPLPGCLLSAVTGRLLLEDELR